LKEQIVEAQLGHLDRTEDGKGALLGIPHTPPLAELNPALQLHDVLVDRKAGQWLSGCSVEGQETKEALTVSLKVHGIDLAQLRPLTNAPDDIAWKGHFNGTVTLHTDFASALKANFAGEILDGQLRMKDGQVRSARIALDNFSVHEKREGKEWRLSAVAVSGTGMKTEIANGNRSLRLVQWQLQGMAERQQNGWRWDVRVPKAKMLGGEWS